MAGAGQFGADARPPAPPTGRPPQDAPGVAVAAATLGFIQAAGGLMFAVAIFLLSGLSGSGERESIVWVVLVVVVIAVLLTVGASMVFKRRTRPLLLTSGASLVFTAISIGLADSNDVPILLALAFSVLPVLTIGLLCTSACRAWAADDAGASR